MKKLFNSQLLIQVTVAAIVATLATAGIVGAATTIGSNVNTGGTLDATGATTLGTTLSVTATSTLNGIIIDTNKFKVEDTSGNTTVGGTLGVTGASTFTGVIGFGTASSTAGGASTLKTATINSDTGAISFGDENLTTTGNIALATASSTGTIKTSSISTDAAGISFNSKNLTAVGDIALATASSTGLAKLDTLKVGAVGDTLSDIQFGTCTVTIGTVTASSTAVATCAATGVPLAGSYKVFVTPYITNPSIIFSSASSTADDVIQIAVYNTGVIGNVDPADNVWTWMAIK